MMMMMYFHRANFGLLRLSVLELDGARDRQADGRTDRHRPSMPLPVEVGGIIIITY